jgi:hypothetical protein
MPHHAELIDRSLPEGLTVADILRGQVSPFDLGRTGARQEVAP